LKEILSIDSAEASLTTVEKARRGLSIGLKTVEKFKIK
jgi:hypothetical protein